MKEPLIANNSTDTLKVEGCKGKKVDDEEQKKKKMKLILITGYQSSAIFC